MGRFKGKWRALKIKMCYTTAVKRFMSFGNFICADSNEGFLLQVSSFIAGFFLHIRNNQNRKISFLM